MAEAVAVIGVVASVAQLADYGFKLSVKLFTFGEAVYAADRSIKSISNDVSLTSTVLKELSEILKADTSNHVSDRAIDAAQQTVTECLAIFEELDKALEKSLENLGALDHDRKKKVNKGAATLERLKWPFKQSKMDILRSNLDRLKASLTLMLQVLSYARELSARKANEQSLQHQKALIEHMARSEKLTQRRYQLALRRETQDSVASTVDPPPQYSSPFHTLSTIPTSVAAGSSTNRGLEGISAGLQSANTPIVPIITPPGLSAPFQVGMDLDCLADQLLLCVKLLEQLLDNNPAQTFLGVIAYKRFRQALIDSKDMQMNVKGLGEHVPAACESLIKQLHILAQAHMAGMLKPDIMDIDSSWEQHLEHPAMFQPSTKEQVIYDSAAKWSSSENKSSESKVIGDRMNTLRPGAVDDSEVILPLDVDSERVSASGPQPGFFSLTEPPQISRHKKGIKSPHVCGQCGKMFSRPEYLWRHEQNHEPSEFPCTWPDCGKVFSRRDLLDQHETAHRENLRMSSFASSTSAQIQNTSGIFPGKYTIRPGLQSIQLPLASTFEDAVPATPEFGIASASPSPEMKGTMKKPSKVFAEDPNPTKEGLLLPTPIDEPYVDQEKWAPPIFSNSTSPSQVHGQRLSASHAIPPRLGHTTSVAPIATPSSSTAGMGSSEISILDGDPSHGPKRKRESIRWRGRVIKRRRRSDTFASHILGSEHTSTSGSMPVGELMFHHWISSAASPPPVPFKKVRRSRDISALEDEMSEISDDEDVVDQLLARWTTLRSSALDQRQLSPGEDEKLAWVQNFPTADVPLFTTQSPSVDETLPLWPPSPSQFSPLDGRAFIPSSMQSHHDSK